MESLCLISCFPYNVVQAGFQDHYLVDRWQNPYIMLYMSPNAWSDTHHSLIKVPVLIALTSWLTVPIDSFPAVSRLLRFPSASNFIYAGIRISAQLLWRNVTPIYRVLIHVDPKSYMPIRRQWMGHGCTYSKQANSGDNASVLLAHNALVCASREVGFGERATSSGGFRGHGCDCVAR